MPKAKKKVVTVPKDVKDPNMSRVIKNPYVKNLFVITIKLGNETYTSKGETMLEAVTSMELPRKIVTKGLLTVTHGEKKGEKMLMPLFLRRIFYPLARFHKAKQLELWLK